MSNVEFRQAGQSDSRKGSAGDHDLAGDAGELVVSGFKNGAADERREFDHASEDLAQAGAGSDDEGGAGPAANDLFVNQKGANGIYELPAGIGGDRKSGKRLKDFAPKLCITK